MSENNILGVVLAGGKSKRFGEEKSKVKLHGKTLLKHTIDKIKSKFDKIIIVSNSKVGEDYITIKDCIDGQLGPLVGVLSAMKWIKKNNFTYNWIATFPCDTPFFKISLIDKFIEASSLKESLLYFVKSEEKRHNIFGLWSVKLIETLEKDIVENKYRKVEKWANKIGVKTINISYQEIDPFFNINTKEDLAEAEKILIKYKND
tara:strand:+ start:1755 stop:2366 length:612 start_codon:yes stop_codon:yes gene_type:complete